MMFHRAVVGVVAVVLVSAQRFEAQEPPRTTSMELDRKIRTFFLAEFLDYAPSGGDDEIRFDALGWIGGDYNRLLLRAEGDLPTRGGGGALEAEAFYGRLVTPFWTALVGARVDARFGGNDQAVRGLLGVGFEGLAPYAWLEVEPTLYVSQEGDLSARLTTSIDVLFSQRLIAQPRLEMNAALQSAPEFDLGSGVNDIELGARLRYEIRREFGPYVGVSWTRLTGGTADIARRGAETVSDLRFVAGLRLWR